jgi:phenylacetate-CoA ligase
MWSKLIYSLGERYRNPSIKSWFKFLKQSESWTIQELENYQLNRLKLILEKAYSESSFYKSLFDKNKIHPSQIKSLNDLKKIPIIDKTTLINNRTHIHTNLSQVKGYMVKTSGTGGQSLQFFRDESADSFNRAAIQRGYSWYHIKPWERNAYFWGFNFSRVQQIKTRFLDTLQNRFRIFSLKPSDLKSFIKKLDNTTYIHGYSSMIYEVAKYINSLKVKPKFNLKLIKGTSETILPHYKAEIRNAFGISIVSEYGATESGIIAFECPHGKLHINMEGVIVEEVDNEIVVTNLQMTSFPVIRYKLGDYIKLSSEIKCCACGMVHKAIDEVQGRIGDLVHGKTHTYPSLTFYYVFKNLLEDHNLGMNYQVIQKDKGNLIFKVDKDLNHKELLLLQTEINKYFKDDITYKIISNYSFKEKTSKHKSFISQI